MNVGGFLTDKRKQRLKDVVSKRQFDLTVVLENIHDPHNIAAVIRSCDAVGISEIYAIITDERIDIARYDMDNKVSSGSRKWVAIHTFRSIEEAIIAIRKKYDKLYGTHMSTESSSLYDLDFSESIALVFGNEHEGLSQELLDELDGNFLIPQYGMVQSLNISVACAVCVFEALRQKTSLGHYAENVPFDEQKEELYQHYKVKSKEHLTFGKEEKMAKIQRKKEERKYRRKLQKESKVDRIRDDGHVENGSEL